MALDDSVIFYYSTTGNSLVAARRVAAAFPGTMLVDMAQPARRRDLPAVLERVGIVFPVHAWGPPVVVEDFLDAAALAQPRYMFAIATSAGNPGNTLAVMRRVCELRELRLDAGFELSMPVNFMLEMDPPTDEKLREIWKQVDAALAGIISGVETRTASFPPSSSERTALSSRFHPGWKGLVKDLGSSFTVSESCNGCGTCTRVCPTANITLGPDKRPRWADRCTCCLACIQWCPRRALDLRVETPAFSGDTAGKRQYHHPDISLKDIVIRGK